MKGISNLEDDGYYLVKRSTSEVVDENNSDEVFVKLRVGDKILRKDKIENVEKAVSINMRFMKINYYPFREICSKYSMFLTIIEYLHYETGRLMYRNGVLINRKGLLKISGVSKNTFDKQLKGLIEDDAIKSVKNGKSVVFFVNPFIVHIGKKVHYSLYELFRDSKYKERRIKTLKGDKDDV
jgi:hypothetical protein